MEHDDASLKTRSAAFRIKSARSHPRDSRNKATCMLQMRDGRLQFIYIVIDESVWRHGANLSSWRVSGTALLALSSVRTHRVVHSLDFEASYAMF